MEDGVASSIWQELPGLGSSLEPGLDTSLETGLGAGG